MARHFVEVKYRSSVLQGGGFAAITPKKLKQMRFAAELYGVRHVTQKNLHLTAVAVSKDGSIDLVEVE